jgi:hypothetical protein
VNTTKRDDSNSRCCPVPAFCLVFISSRDSGPSMSQTALEIGRWLGFRKDGVGEMEMVCKWWPKWSSPNPRLLGEFIRVRSAKLEGNRGIKSLLSLQIFSDRCHTARMPFVDAVNDFCWSHGSSVGVEAQFGTQFLSFSAQYPWNV